MPKFVPVTNPELARSEQDQDESLAKHRAWDAKQYIAANRTGDNMVRPDGVPALIGDPEPSQPLLRFPLAPPPSTP